MGSLSTDDGDGNGNVRKSSIGLIGKKKLCTYITLFCAFLCRHFFTTTWNSRMWRSVEDVDTQRRIPFLLSTLRFVFTISFPGTFNYRYMWHVKRVGIIATRFDITRSPFMSDCNVLLSSPPSLLKLFNRKLGTLRSDGHANGNVAEK